jgi:hypothetical protein
MDTARQVLRFSIPGSILLLHGIVCYFIYRRCQGVTFVEASNALRENIAGVVAILATIPIGFVVYQGYYFTYGPILRFWPRQWKGNFVRADRGWPILSSLETQQVEALEAIFNVDIELSPPYDVVEAPEHWYRSPRQKVKHWLRLLELKGELKELPLEAVAADGQKIKPREKAYTDRWYSNWDVLRSILDIAGSIPESSQIKAEYTTLSDLYHSLGAARTAVVGGWTLVAILAVTHFGRVEHNLLRSVAGFAAMTAVTVLLYFVLHSARRRTWKSASASLRLGLRWLFWRHHEEFAPSEAWVPGRKRKGSMLRGRGGSAAHEEDDPDDETRRIRDSLRSAPRAARERISDVMEKVTGKEVDGEEGASAETGSAVSAPTPPPARRRAPLAVATFAALLGIAIVILVWPTLSPASTVALAIGVCGLAVAAVRELIRRG